MYDRQGDRWICKIDAAVDVHLQPAFDYKIGFTADKSTHEPL